jgi:hypothetical protein
MFQGWEGIKAGCGILYLFNVDFQLFIAFACNLYDPELPCLISLNLILSASEIRDSDIFLSP